MTHLVRHRGPNGFGFAFIKAAGCPAIEVIHNQDRFPSNQRPVVGLGSRRLSILDLSAAGNMPMLSGDGSCCITFNGEIYNYKEIREELRQLGYKFRTETDTEVILQAYREWGENCLERFNGMWSFALWDQIRQRLFCARDRFGVKPFYYTLNNGAFYFASEIKQILLASSMARKANPRTVYSFLEWGLLDHAEETFFEGIFQLPAGHCLCLDFSDPLKPMMRRYWELRIKPAPEVSEQNAADEFKSLFESSVKLRLRSDVPVGISLSGGLDSSSLLWQAKSLSPDSEFQAFSSCFEARDLDEREYISAALLAVQGIGHAVYPQGGPFWEDIRSIIYHQDEPLMSVGCFPHWCVMRRAQQGGVPVLLSGQGGDETLCGYQKYRYFYLWHLLNAADPRLFRELALWFCNGTSFYWNLGSGSRYLPPILQRPFSLTKRLCLPDFRKTCKGMTSGIGASKSIAERQKTDLTYSSLPCLLHHEDRISMAHSIESRLPFLDYRLVEFLVNCAPSLKLRDGWSKWLMREAMKGSLPEKIRLRKTKLGFNAPDNDWVRLGLQNGHRIHWEKPALRLGRFFDERNFVQECQQFLKRSTTALSADLIFRALSLELWAEVYDVS